MSYRDSIAGRVEIEASVAGRVFYSFDLVEERLVEALARWWRTPDRERGWLHVKALWPDILRTPGRLVIDGEHDEQEAIVLPKRPQLTRDEIAEMIEASEWLAHVEERDRRLVAIVLALKARGVKKVQWLRVWDRLGRGRPGPDGLRMRYSRAVANITKSLNG